MKKTLFLLCMAALVGRAQPYGEKLYPHQLTFCSSGELTSANTPGLNGFITSGIVPAIPFGGFPNYYIDKTDDQGQFGNPGAFPFSNAYFLFGDQNCSPAFPQVKGTFGSDVIEATTSSINGWYAQTIATEMGVFFSMLDPNGAPILVPGGFYPFPNGAKNPTRPVIVASPTPMEYFICGSYELNGLYEMYVIGVKESGTISVGSVIYRFPGSVSSITPADMIVSPYTPSPSGVNELAIVGKVTNAFFSAGSGDRGFLMRLDVNTLQPVAGAPQLLIYGQPFGAGGVDSFGCITEAASFNAGGNGFAIGGHTDANGTAGGFVWSLKVDPTGNVIYWNTVTQPLTDQSAPDMVAMKERFSNFYGKYEYYGAVISGKGMMVIKLDDNGIPFTSGVAIDNFNEFLYYGPQAAPGVVRDLTLLDMPSPTGVGIHVYGTDDQFGGGFHYFVEAGFNGYSDGGCPTSNIYTGALSQPGPPNIFFRDIIQFTGLQWCPNFNIAFRPQQTQPKVLCNSPVLPTQGSVNRTSATTGISAQANAVNHFNVSPNPVTNKVEVKFSAAQNDVVDIKLYDYLGRYIAAIPVMAMDGGNARIAALDLSTLTIESGVYIIKASVNGVSSQQKIIYTKGQ